MNVSCPQCSTVYRVDPAKVPEGGVRARCSTCGGVIPVGISMTPARPQAPIDAMEEAFASRPAQPGPFMPPRPRNPTPRSAPRVTPISSARVTPPQSPRVATPPAPRPGATLPPLRPTPRAPIPAFVPPPIVATPPNACTASGNAARADAGCRSIDSCRRSSRRFQFRPLRRRHRPQAIGSGSARNACSGRVRHFRTPADQPVPCP